MQWNESAPRSELPCGKAHLWRLDLDVCENTLRTLQGFLSREEIDRAARFRFPVLRRRYVVGRGALRAIVGGYLQEEPAHLGIAYTQFGKPFVANPGTNLHFNISHSDTLWVAAVCVDKPLGVDIERESARIDAMAIAERYFSEREKAEIAGIPAGDRTRAFFRLWTAKEATMKATSLGFALDLDRVEIGLQPLRVLAIENDTDPDWRLIEFRPGDDFCGAVAVNRQFREIKCHDLVVRR